MTMRILATIAVLGALALPMTFAAANPQAQTQQQEQKDKKGGEKKGKDKAKDKSGKEQK